MTAEPKCMDGCVYGYDWSQTSKNLFFSFSSSVHLRSYHFFLLYCCCCWVFCAFVWCAFPSFFRLLYLTITLCKCISFSFLHFLHLLLLFLDFHRISIKIFSFLWVFVECEKRVFVYHPNVSKLFTPFLRVKYTYLYMYNVYMGRRWEKNTNIST